MLRLTHVSEHTTSPKKHIKFPECHIATQICHGVSQLVIFGDPDWVIYIYISLLAEHIARVIAQLATSLPTASAQISGVYTFTGKYIRDYCNPYYWSYPLPNQSISMKWFTYHQWTSNLRLKVLNQVQYLYIYIHVFNHSVTNQFTGYTTT